MVMNRSRSRFCTGIFFLSVGCIFVLMTGCSDRYKTLQSFLDTPSHHTSNGFDFLDRGQMSDAEREFQAALRLDHSFSQAHCGLGLIAGSRGNYPQAFRSMKEARNYAKSAEDRATCAVGQMRLYTMKKSKNWLHYVENFFDDAVQEKPSLPEASFYLGIALKESYRFHDAEEAFRKAMIPDSRLFWQARQEANKIRKIIKGAPTSQIGRKVALQDTITRAEVAGLLVEELNLPEVYRNVTRVRKQSPLCTFPPDITAHPLKNDIKVVLELGLRDLGCFQDGSFRPEQPVSRAEYAVIMADIIAAVHQESDRDARFSQRTSPFLDIGNSDPFFNAVIICTINIPVMEPRQGSFNPWGAISGPDAVLALRKLRDALDV